MRNKYRKSVESQLAATVCLRQTLQHSKCRLVAVRATECDLLLCFAAVLLGLWLSHGAKSQSN